MDEALAQQFAIESMENGYLILTGKVNFNVELRKYFREGRILPVSFDPSDEITEEIISNHIEHFAHYEEYEKCAELKELLDNEVKSIKI